MSPTWFAHPDGFLRAVPSGQIGPPWDDSFVLGVTEPTALNTGPRVSEAQLSNYSGSLTNISNGEVIDRLIITGRVNSPTATFTVRDSIIRGGEPTPTGQDPVVRNNKWALADTRSSATSLARYEYVTFDPSYSSHEIYGFRGGNFEAYRCNLSGMTDAFSVHGSGTYPSTTNKNVKIHGCYVWRFPIHPDPDQGDNITHNDGIQSAGALNTLEIVGNSIGFGEPRARTSCILLQKNAGTYVNPIVVTDNWLYGHTTDGSTFNMSETLPGSVTEGYGPGALLFLRNRIDGTGNSPRILVKPNSRFAANFGMTGTSGNTSGWVAGPNANVLMGGGIAYPSNG